MIRQIRRTVVDYIYTGDSVKLQRIALNNSVAEKRIPKAKRPKSLFVDVSIIVQNDARTGIQRVVRAVLSELIKNPPNGYEVRPVFATSKDEYRVIPSATNIKLLSEDKHSISGKSITIKSGDVFLGLDLATVILSKHKKQLIQWKTNGANIHIFVYDLLPVIRPEWFNSRATLNFYRWLQTVALIADGVTCISNTVKNDFHYWLHSRYGIDSTDIPAQVLSLGCDIDASEPSKGLPTNSNELLEVFNATKSAILVGTIEPRKGHLDVLKAFESIWASGELVNLVIAGKQGWKSRKLLNQIKMHAQYGRQLFWLDSVSDEYLSQLYSAAKCVIVASINEGFGLPIIEALSHNKPVIARKIPVFCELPYEGIVFFDDKADAQVLGNLILEVLNSDSYLKVNDSHKMKSKPIKSWQQATNDLSTYISQNYSQPGLLL